MEVVLELVEEFEEKASKCEGLVASYEKAVSGLRVSSLEGNLQLWTAANRVNEAIQSSDCRLYAVIVVYAAIVLYAVIVV